MENYLLFGYSRAPKYNYIPPSFKKLNTQLGNIKAEGQRRAHFKLSYKKRDLAQQIIDCYGKIGFLFIAKDYIQQENSLRNYTHEPHYHLYNFIYDTKAFLDAVSVLLNDHYSLGRSGGHIDLKHYRFRQEIIEEEPLLMNILKKKEKWILDVVKWRESVIHKLSIPLGYSLDHESAEKMSPQNDRPALMMPNEPIPYLISDYSEIIKKYGSVWQPIEPFCDLWIKNACELFDTVCETISSSLLKRASA